MGEEPKRDKHRRERGGRMRNYTTPTIMLNIPSVTLTGMDVHITFSDMAQNVVIDTAPTAISQTDSGTQLSIDMTQEQTALFSPSKKYLVQVNWLDGNKRFATNIVRFQPKANLLKEVLP